MGIETRGEKGRAFGGSFEGDNPGIQPKITGVQLSDTAQTPRQLHIRQPEGGLLVPDRLPTVAVESARVYREVQRKDHPGTLVIESYRGSPTLWGAVEHDVSPLFHSVYGEIYASNKRLTEKQRADIPEELALDHQWLQEKISAPKSTIVMLFDGDTKSVVGFSSAFPTYVDPTVESILEELDGFDREDEYRGFTNVADYKAYTEQALTIGTTAIDPAYRGQGGWRPMMDALIERVKEQGEYPYLERYVRFADHYAEKVLAHPGGEIICEGDTLSDYLGDQKYIRIKL